jgi:hypothetical protein
VADARLRERILQILGAVPNGVLYSTTDWHRILKADKREIRNTLKELEAAGDIEIQKSGRTDKPLYRLKQ